MPAGSLLQPVSLAGFTVPPSDAAGGASQAATSLDGRFIVYTSDAPNLVPGQVNVRPENNVFLYDRQLGTTTLISHDAANPLQTANAASESARISGDGRYVAFTSQATDLVPGQAGSGPFKNVYLYDRQNGTTTLVSHDVTSPGTAGNGDSDTAFTTGFGSTNTVGRYLIFHSSASDLVAGQAGPSRQNLFVYDALLGTTSLVSHDVGSLTQGADNDTLGQADISGDGSFVTYTSYADDLVPGQVNQNPVNVFLYNNAAPTHPNTLVSGVAVFNFLRPPSVSPTTGAGDSSLPLINGDGSVVVYTSFAPNLVVGQSSSNNSALFFNVFRYSRLAGQTTLVSGANGSATTTANDVSTIAALSADGNVVAFVSAATNLTAGEGNTKDNVFLYNAARAAQGQQPLTLVSSVSGEPGVAAGGVTAYRSLRESDISTLGSPFEPDTNLTDKFVSLSPDGRFVSYQSYASDLVPNQGGPPLSGPEEFLPGGAVPEGYQNTFLFDALSGGNRLVSGVNGSGQVTGDRGTIASVVTDGGSVLFLSMADNLNGGLLKADGGFDVFLSGAAGQPPTLVTRATSPATPQTFVVSTSADGRYVVFTSNATNVVPGQVDANSDQDVFLLDRQTGTTVLVSHTPNSPTTAADAGSPGDLPAATVPGVSAVISADGNYVAFVSSADNLVPDQARFPADIYTNMYLYNRQTGQVTLLTGYSGSATATGLASTFRPVISADGRYVAFTSTLESFFTEVFVYDRDTDTLKVVSAGPPAGPDGDSDFAGISDDGRYITYQSRSDNLTSGVPPRSNNVYLFDQTATSTTLVSHAAPFAGAGAGNNNSIQPVISPDGSTVAFTSYATDLVAGQVPSPFSNVFRYRVADGSIALVSGSGGSPQIPAAGNSDSPALSADGSFLAFRSDAPDLIAGETGPVGSNIFLFDAQPGAAPLTLVSHAAGNFTTRAAGSSTDPVIDGDGQLVAYLSTAGDLVPDQSGGQVNNVFGWDRSSRLNFLASGAQGSVTTASAAPAFSPLLSRDPVLLFNVVGSLFQDPAKINAYANRLVDIAFTPAALLDGSPPGTVAGTLSVLSVLGGQVVLPQYSLPAGAAPDDGLFAAGTTRQDGTAALLTQFVVNVAGQSSFTILVQAATGLGTVERLFILAASPGTPTRTSPAHPLVAELVALPAGKKKTRLMLEVFDLFTGAEVMALVCPFQAPTYRAVTVMPLGNGLFLLSARKGKHTVMALLAA